MYFQKFGFKKRKTTFQKLYTKNVDLETKIKRIFKISI